MIEYAIYQYPTGGFAGDFFFDDSCISRTDFRKLTFEFLKAETRELIDKFINEYGELQLCEILSKDPYCVMRYIDPRHIQKVFTQTFLLYNAIMEKDILCCIKQIWLLSNDQYFFDSKLPELSVFYYDDELPIDWDCEWLNTEYLNHYYEIMLGFTSEINQDTLKRHLFRKTSFEFILKCDELFLPFYKNIIIESDKDNYSCYINDREAILDFSARILGKVLSYFADDVKMLIQYDHDKDTLFNYWKSPSLINCLFLDLRNLITKGKIVRKCSNKTCEQYFEIIGDDKRKIYCCERCAKTEAKRKQRSREKVRKSVEMMSEQNE